MIVALITPFTRQGRVDTDGLRVLTQWLIECEVDGLCPLGTTGESQKLDREERKLVLSTVIDEAKSDLPIIAGTGAITTRDTITYTEDAKDLGACASLILPPWLFNFKPETILSHYRTVSENVDFPIILYNLPSAVGYSIPPEVVVEASRIDNVIGIKDSGANMLYYQNIINQTSKEFNVIQGYASLFFPSLLLGGRTSINGESNVAPKIAVDMYKSYMNGDYVTARRQHFKLVDLISVILYGTLPVAIKEAMNIIGLPGGTTLPPATPLSKKEKRKLRETLIKIGLLKK